MKPAAGGLQAHRTAPAASNARRLARACLGLSGALLGVFILVGPSFGSALILAQATESPSPTASPSPTGPVEPEIQLLSPSDDYDTVLFPEPQEEDLPKVSDKYDGFDRSYHLSAWVRALPTNAIVEAYIEYPDESEITIGIMDAVPGRDDVFELYWPIPDSFAEGEATIRVRLFQQTATGFDEIAKDEELVDMQHNDRPPAPTTSTDTTEAEETIEISWPSQNGPLGFYKAAKGTWRTVVEGTMSNNGRVSLAYTTTPVGQKAVYKYCVVTTAGSAVRPDASRTWAFNCALAGKDTPSQVTAIAAVAVDIDDTHSGLVAAFSEDSADVHVIQPYVQTTDQMKLAVDSFTTPTDAPDRRRTVILDSSGKPLQYRCLSFRARVTDHLDRPVQGANIDAHLQNPTDQLWFGFDTDDGDSTILMTGTYKNPDKGSHTTENAFDCQNDGPEPNDGMIPADQGEQNIPGGNDIKHRESAGGSGVSGGQGAGFGGWVFNLRSNTPGLTNIVVWIDDEDRPSETVEPEADSDTLEPDEPSVTTFGQWYAEAPTLQFDPAGGSARAGECAKYTLKARSKLAAVPQINVDIHAVGPDDNLDFCDPEGATPGRRAPDKGPAANASPHEPEDAGEAAHAGASPKTQHTEFETDDAGNIVFGIISPTAGDTTITAWIDGETEFDNDIQDAGEPTRTISHSWASATGDAEISWVNPSGYGGTTTARTGGDQISNKRDADTNYHLVTRVDTADLIEGVEYLYSTDGTTFTVIGDATRVGTTDTYGLLWPMSNIADSATAVLRAHIKGTTIVEDRQVTVNNTAPAAPDPRDIPFQAVEITKPPTGTSASFLRGTVTVDGIASIGTDGVDLFYSKFPAKDTPGSVDWILCGYVDLSGSAVAPQGFKGSCALVGADQPSQVSALAAIAVDCTAAAGENCDASVPKPTQGVTPPRQANRASGDAHRVFGVDANPIIAIEPAEAEAETDTCKKFVFTAVDQVGQPIVDAGIDLHLTGPANDAVFCDISGETSPRSAPNEGGHITDPTDPNSGVHDFPEGSDTRHIEGNTSSTGEFVFAVTSSSVGDSQIFGWIDQTENDIQDTGENGDGATMHWVGEVEPDRCTIRGTAADDVIEGTSGDDVICSRAGNDVVKGLRGNDKIFAGLGADTVRGGEGDDRIFGRPGGDELFGGHGTDTVQGGRGKDQINGGSGNDDCTGGPGKDRVTRCE